MLKKSLLLFFLYKSIFAQVGIGTTTPNDNASLELGETNKGLVLNKVALSDITLPNPLTEHVAGLMVYNTATAGTPPNNVTPGLYYNDGNSWLKLSIQVVPPRGIERIDSNNGTFNLVGTNFVWNANAGAPSLQTTTEVVAPFGSTTSYITVSPGGIIAGIPQSDSFICTKNIISLRVYVQIQASAVNTNSRWRTFLFLNNVLTASFWGAPTNSANNVRTQCVFEYGPITANTPISISIEKNNLPNSTQNQGTYIVVEYEL
jgi:hypothetical protein